MIEIHHSISKTEKVFDSGGRPILVECEDYNTWVCKHGHLTPRLLLNELIGSSFAKIWELDTPDFCLLEISEEHIPATNSLQPAFFRKHCFGSFFNQNDKVIDLTTLPMLRTKGFKGKILNKTDYLKIALFDIWLANEDRNPMHTNLLLSNVGKKYMFKVFDHDALFNQDTIGRRPLVLLDEECSLISGEITKLLFKRNKKLVNNVDNIVENFYICVAKCMESLPNILDSIPDSWDLSKEEVLKGLTETVFTDKWVAECENHFRELTQKYI